MKRFDIKVFRWRLMVILLLISPSLAFAINGELTDSSGKKAVSKPVVIMPAAKISQIIKFRVDTISTAEGTKTKTTTLSEDKQIIITISNPKDFLLSRPSDNSQLILYADGFPLNGMNTTYFTQVSRQYLNDTSKYWPNTIAIPFLFKRDTSTETAWNSMFHLAKWSKNRITFDMSLGWSGMFPLQVSDPNVVKNKVTVVFYSKPFFIVFSILYGVFILCFVWLCHTTGLIREPDKVNGINGAYSLAQTQLAFWTVIVIGGFGYLWLLTGQADALNNSVLLLLGISSTTTGAAGLIDYYKKITLEKNLNNLAATVPTDPAVQQSAVVVPVIIPNTIKQHRSFILDILSDGVNISVQRTQTVMWNLVLGLYFIWYIITNKAMPEFSDTLLVLAGVSSVLYVGSKGPENPQTKPLPVTQ